MIWLRKKRLIVAFILILLIAGAIVVAWALRNKAELTSAAVIVIINLLCLAMSSACQDRPREHGGLIESLNARNLWIYVVGLICSGSSPWIN